jgi:ribulose-5-phosphate 4-epimerase/fuculose-1-phosphate aldolase
MLPAPQVIFGYHGCDESVLRMVLDGGMLRPSQNAYDWLGHGIYFWERSAVRAMRWAQEMASQPNSNLR